MLLNTAKNMNIVKHNHTFRSGSLVSKTILNEQLYAL